MERLLPLAETLAQSLIARSETLAVSESSAGGLISASLLAVPGASAYYRGGGIIYAPNAFRGLLQLSRDDLGDMRSATEPYAIFLARTMRTKLRTSWGLCETGASGPSGNSYGDAAGQSGIAVVGPQGQAIARTLETGLSERVENMYRFAEAGLDLLWETLQSTPD